MSRWIILGVVVIALSAAATVLTQYAPISETGPSPNLATNEATGPHPTVEISEKLEYDFGTMPQQVKGTHSWEVKNAGDADLDIWLLESTCSCTIGKLKAAKGQTEKKATIKPKESTTIDLEWETRNKHDDYDNQVKIGTNDPAHRSVTLRVKGKVFPAVMVYPPEMITLDGISNEAPTEAYIAVYSKDRPETKITKISTSRPDFMVAKQRPLDEKERKQFELKVGGYQVTVAIKPGMPLGRFHEELVIETDHPRQPETRVTIAGYTTGPISVVPERLRMEVSSSEGATRSLTVLVRGDLPKRFEIAHHPDGVEVVSATKPGGYLLTVTVPPGAAAKLIEDEIVIKTDKPSATEVKIPVTIMISNAGAG